MVVGTCVPIHGRPSAFAPKVQDGSDQASSNPVTSGLLRNEQVFKVCRGRLRPGPIMDADRCEAQELAFVLRTKANNRGLRLDDHLPGVPRHPLINLGLVEFEIRTPQIQPVAFMPGFERTKAEQRLPSFQRHSIFELAVSHPAIVDRVLNRARNIVLDQQV